MAEPQVMTVEVSAADVLEAVKQWAFVKSGIKVPQVVKVTLGGSWVVAPEEPLVLVTFRDLPENVEHISWSKPR